MHNTFRFAMNVPLMFTVCVFYLAEDAEYMIMNCPSGSPGDLRESTTAEADLTEEALSASSTEWLQPNVSSRLIPTIIFI